MSAFFGLKQSPERVSCATLLYQLRGFTIILETKQKHFYENKTNLNIACNIAKEVPIIDVEYVSKTNYSSEPII